MPGYTFLFFCLKVRVLANRILRAQWCFWTISLPFPSTMLESSVQRFWTGVLSSPEEKKLQAPVKVGAGMGSSINELLEGSRTLNYFSTSVS